jgi:hypothetical protein
MYKASLYTPELSQGSGLNSIPEEATVAHVYAI